MTNLSTNTSFSNTAKPKFSFNTSSSTSSPDLLAPLSLPECGLNALEKTATIGDLILTFFQSSSETVTPFWKWIVELVTFLEAASFVSASEALISISTTIFKTLRSYRLTRVLEKQDPEKCIRDLLLLLKDKDKKTLLKNHIGSFELKKLKKLEKSMEEIPSEKANALIQAKALDMMKDLRFECKKRIFIHSFTIFSSILTTFSSILKILALFSLLIPGLAPIVLAFLIIGIVLFLVRYVIYRIHRETINGKTHWKITHLVPEMLKKIASSMLKCDTEKILITEWYRSRSLF